jgi:hypothetical protein
LHSLAPGPIHFRISWETRGLLPRDGLASNVDTKEVIDGGGLFFGTSRAANVAADVTLGLSAAFSFLKLIGGKTL